MIEEASEQKKKKRKYDNLEENKYNKLRILVRIKENWIYHKVEEVTTKELRKWK